MSGEEDANLKCSFCGKSRQEVRSVELLRSVLQRACALPIEIEALEARRESDATERSDDRCSPRFAVVPVTTVVPVALGSCSSDEEAKLSCWFCGKPGREVRALVAGPVVMICDECTLLCCDIIAEELGGPSGHLDAAALVAASRDIRESKTCDVTVDSLRWYAERARACAKDIDARVGRTVDQDGVPGAPEGSREPDEP